VVAGTGADHQERQVVLGGDPALASCVPVPVRVRAACVLVSKILGTGRADVPG
jgi:hypothetical protein